MGCGPDNGRCVRADRMAPARSAAAGGATATERVSPPLRRPATRRPPHPRQPAALVHLATKTPTPSSPMPLPPTRTPITNYGCITGRLRIDKRTPMKCLSEEREQPNQWVRGTSSAPGRGPLWRGCVFLLRAQFVDNPRAVVDQVLWSRKRRFCGTSGGWRVMCVVAVAGVSGRELRMPARGPVGGVRLGWLGRWGGVRGVADFFESFQCRKPGRGGVEAAAGGAAPGDWSTR